VKFTGDREKLVQSQQSLHQGAAKARTLWWHEGGHVALGPMVLDVMSNAMLMLPQKA